MTATAWALCLGQDGSRGRVVPLGVAVLLSTLSGVLMSAALPPLDVSALAFVSWAPLLVAVRGQSARHAVLLGLVQGVSCQLAGFSWLLDVIVSFTHWPRPAAACVMVLLFVYGAGRVGLATWLCAWATQRGWPPGCVFLLALGGTESVYPLLFPWYSGAQVHRLPVLLQAADLGGPVLVSVLMAASSVAVAELVWCVRERRPASRARLVLALACPALLVAYGVARMTVVERAIASAPTGRVGLVQANVEQAGTRHRDSAALHRDATVALEREGPLDLVVWPETAISAVMGDEDLPVSLVAALGHGVAASVRAPVLSGAVLRRGQGITNSAILFQPGGAVLGVYDKVHPLAFGEYLPLSGWLPSLRRWVPNAGQVTSGTSLRPLALGARRLGVLICYEDLLANHATRTVREGAPDLLVNLTNDVWFGGTAAPRLHLALAKFRAIENRRFLVRAANTGVSAFVDPLGRTIGEMPVGQAAAMAGTVHWMRGATVYQSLEESPWWAAAALALALAFVRRGRLRARA